MKIVKIKSHEIPTTWYSHVHMVYWYRLAVWDWTSSYQRNSGIQWSWKWRIFEPNCITFIVKIPTRSCVLYYLLDILCEISTHWNIAWYCMDYFILTVRVLLSLFSWKHYVFTEYSTVHSNTILCLWYQCDNHVSAWSAE